MTERQMNETVILIPHYNDVEGLKKSIRSVADCGFDADVLVVDDGSSVKPSADEMIAIYKQTRIIYSLSNRGIESAMNIGLKEIISVNRYKYIARLDCGDTCLKDRLVKQYRFLENNPDVYLLGTAGQYVDGQGKKLWVFYPPCGHDKIKTRMFVNNMFIHPSVMFRTEAIKTVGFYPSGYPCAEDYALFFAMVKKFKTANLPDILINKEISPGAISIKNRKKQMRSRLRIICGNFSLSPWWFYGIIRNSLLYCLPGNTIDKLKCKVKN